MDHNHEHDEPDAGRMPFSKRKSAPLPVDNERLGQIFVSDKVVDGATGDVYWLASPLSPDDSEQSFKIRVPANSPERGNILRALENNYDMPELHIIRRSGADHYEIISAKPALPDEKRAVHDDKGHAFTWTKGLDTKVDEYFQTLLQTSASGRLGQIQSSPECVDALLKQAGEVYAATKRDAGDLRSVEDIAIDFNKKILDVHAGDFQRFDSLMSGWEPSENGEMRKIYYDPQSPFREQTGADVLSEKSEAALANYAIQRALHADLVSHLSVQVEGKGGRMMSRLELAEEELVEKRALFGHHPTRKPFEYAKLTTEFAERIATNSIQGASMMLGGSPASLEHDYVTPSNSSPRDARGVPYTAQTFLQDRAKVIAGLPPLDDYLANGGSREVYMRTMLAEMAALGHSHLTAKEMAITHETDKAMANGRTRVPDNSGRVKEIVQHFGSVDSGTRSLDEIDGISIV